MTTIQALSPEDAAPRIATLHVIDVRAEHEFRGPLGHVRGARWLPLAEIEARAGELPTDRPLLLVCRSGARSGKACEQLTALRIGPALNLAGGMIAWNRARLPVERCEPACPSEILDGLVAWAAQVRGRQAETVRDELRDALVRERHAFGNPTPACVGRAIDLVETSLRRGDPPPDLELSVAVFRRWLAALPS